MPQIRKIVKADYERKLSWFRLRRYEIERIMNFSHYDWALQIAYRMDLIDRAKQWHSEEWNQLHLEDDRDIATGKRIHQAFKVIKSTPLISFARIDPGFINAWDFPTLFPLLYSRDGSLSIRPLTVSEYYLHEYELDFATLRYGREFFRGSDLFQTAVDGVVSPTTFVTSARAEFRNRWEDVCIWANTYSGHRLPYKKVLNEPVHRHTRTNGQVLLTVDPKAPDKQIHDQLDLVLKRLRRSSKTIPRVKFNPNSWIESGLLPYFDLCVWSAIEDLSKPPCLAC